MVERDAETAFGLPRHLAWYIADIAQIDMDNVPTFHLNRGLAHHAAGGQVAHAHRNIAWRG